MPHHKNKKTKTKRAFIQYIKQQALSSGLTGSHFGIDLDKAQSLVQTFTSM